MLKSQFYDNLNKLYIDSHYKQISIWNDDIMKYFDRRVKPGSMVVKRILNE